MWNVSQLVKLTKIVAQAAEAVRNETTDSNAAATCGVCGESQALVSVASTLLCPAHVPAVTMNSAGASLPRQVQEAKTAYGRYGSAVCCECGVGLSDEQRVNNPLLDGRAFCPAHRPAVTANSASAEAAHVAALARESRLPACAVCGSTDIGPIATAERMGRHGEDFLCPPCASGLQVRTNNASAEAQRARATLRDATGRYARTSAAVPPSLYGEIGLAIDDSLAATASTAAASVLVRDRRQSGRHGVDGSGERSGGSSPTHRLFGRTAVLRAAVDDFLADGSAGGDGERGRDRERHRDRDQARARDHDRSRDRSSGKGKATGRGGGGGGGGGGSGVALVAAASALGAGSRRCRRPVEIAPGIFFCRTCLPLGDEEELREHGRKRETTEVSSDDRPDDHLYQELPKKERSGKGRPSRRERERERVERAGSRKASPTREKLLQTLRSSNVNW
eukprot:CAMPEP_0170756202 /NCGR_PEP_ID=MMETSP0437-20130122/13906_1 /TAXON_ID=0 /ORGANISM="Sexangularia sp." /LENGTH=450 /DNA_ID=CAMNT_0011095383 /DNA_START=213 /DNA_END=1567 /DNA_ORIENTATION=-